MGVGREGAETTVVREFSLGPVVFLFLLVVFCSFFPFCWCQEKKEEVDYLWRRLQHPPFMDICRRPWKLPIFLADRGV